MAQRPLQRDVVSPKQSLEESLERHIDPAVLLVVLRLNETAAQHRRERQRNETRNEHRHHDDHGEFMQQPPDNPTHEKHGDEHSRKRQRHRNNRESDFLGTFERRLHRVFAHFHVPNDFFQHHDRVVHYESHRERQRHQRQIVHRVVEQVHHRKRARNGHRQRDAWDYRGRKIPQEQENHQDDQANRQEQRGLYVVHRLLNQRG